MPEVNIVGTLQGASFLPDDCAATYCRFKFTVGAGWTCLDGASQGQTQTAIVSPLPATGAGGIGSGERNAAWQHPLDIHYSSATLTGWPQLVVTMWKQDSLERNEIAGYGCIRIPCSPGIHHLEIALWRPEGSWWQELSASFLGGGLPHLTDTSIVADPQSGLGRHRLVTVSTGIVSVDINVLCKGFSEHGVVFAQ